MTGNEKENFIGPKKQKGATNCNCVEQHKISKFVL